MYSNSEVNAGGSVTVDVIKGKGYLPEGDFYPTDIKWSGEDWPPAVEIREILKNALPRPRLPREVNKWRMRNLPNISRGLWRILVSRGMGIPTMYGALYIDVVRADGKHVPYGLASLRMVTNDGIAYLVNSWSGSGGADLNAYMKYHGIGTNSTAEQQTDSILGTESTTALNPSSVRATGSLASNSTTTLRTVGELVAASQIVTREHGLFTASVPGTGTLWDRSVFATVTLEASDTIRVTYDATFNAGS